MRYDALLAAIVIGVSPVVGLAAPAIAQQQFQLRSVQLYAGTALPGTIDARGGTRYFYPDTTYPLTLTIARDIYNEGGWLVVPAGSQIVGSLQPSSGGSRFYGHTLIVTGRERDLQASSDLIHDEKDPREYSDESIAEDAAIGAASGALIGALAKGRVSLGGILGGAATGVGVGNITAPQVVVLRPNQQVDVFLDRDLRW